MPRLGNSSANAAGNVTNRTCQLNFCWSVSYEFGLRNRPLEATSQEDFLRGRAQADDLNALLDKALAYAG